MKIIKNSVKVQAADTIKSKDDLKQALWDILDDNICVDVVNLAFSEDNEFEQDVFFDSDTFFDTLAETEPYEVARMFFMGEDLDASGPANPTRDYFRFNGYGNVESTNDPGDTYYHVLDNDIVAYIMEHLDDREFPEEVMEVISKYQEEE